MQKSEEKILKTKRKKAIALSYDDESNKAPVVVASGSGYTAEKILEVAEKVGVPVFEDETTTTLLCQLEIGQEIPEKLYEVVAQIFAHIMTVAQGARR